MMTRAAANDSDAPRDAPSAHGEGDRAPEGVPVRDHPIDVAARAGFGPLSSVAERVWHGDSAPCVTCGQLVRRSTSRCPHCDQDLNPEMIERMRTHAGPWSVLEHVRPFPGVSLERIIRQIHRGRITETTILRGPNTDYQWRYAVETPGLSIYFLRCWKCHAEIAPTAAFCPKCHAHLYFDVPIAEAIGGIDNESAGAAPPSPVVFGRSTAPASATQSAGRERPPPEIAGGQLRSTVPSRVAAAARTPLTPSAPLAPRVADANAPPGGDGKPGGSRPAATPEFDALRNALAAVPDLTSSPARAVASTTGRAPYAVVVGVLLAAMAILVALVQFRSAVQHRDQGTSTPTSVPAAAGSSVAKPSGSGSSAPAPATVPPSDHARNRN